MRLGLIARTENRGLGNLAFEVYAHLHPDRVLVVVPNHPIPQRFDRYPDATVVRWNQLTDSLLDEDVVRAWLDGLDCVYSAETFYDWRVCDWAREQHVRTVCHVMPEFYRHGVRTPPPKPDVWWTPTRWRIGTLPKTTRVVPVPIATERFGPPSERDGPLRWLHPAGTRAASDRNGTKIVLGALPQLTEEHRVTIRSQEPDQHAPPVPPTVALTVITEPVAEYWDAYTNTDLLILPRRYAGLSLPVLEAMAAGCGIVMSDAEPQRSEWPIIPLRAIESGWVRTPAGRIPTAKVMLATVAETMDGLARDPEAVNAARAEARSYAESHSWARLEPLIRAELSQACG